MWISGVPCAKPTQAWLDLFLNPLKSNECIFLLLDLCYCNVLSPPPGSIEYGAVNWARMFAQAQVVQNASLTLACCSHSVRLLPIGSYDRLCSFRASHQKVAFAKAGLIRISQSKCGDKTRGTRGSLFWLAQITQGKPASQRWQLSDTPKKPIIIQHKVS